MPIITTNPNIYTETNKETGKVEKYVYDKQKKSWLLVPTSSQDIQFLEHKNSQQITENPESTDKKPKNFMGHLGESMTNPYYTGVYSGAHGAIPWLYSLFQDPKVQKDAALVGVATVANPVKAISDFLIRPIATNVSGQKALWGTLIDDIDISQEEYDQRYNEARDKIIRSLHRFSPDIDRSDKERTEIETQAFLDSIIDPETQEIRSPETGVGMTLQIGTYLVGGKAIFELANKVNKFRKLGTVPKAIITEQAVEQLLTNPNYNMANMSQDMFELDDPVISYLAASHDDDVLLNRAKMAVVGLVLVGSIVVGAKGVKNAWSNLGFNSDKISKRAEDTFGKPLDELNEEEVESLAEMVLRDAKEMESLSSTGLVKGVNDVARESDEEVARVIRQSEGGILGTATWLKQRWFTSRGFYSKKAQLAAEESIYRQRALQLKSTHIANRLDTLMDDIIDSTDDSNIIERVNEALINPRLHNLPEEKQVEILLETLPPDIVSEVFRARTIIDELSETLLDSRVVTEATREAIGNNLGQHLRRNFRLHEDPNFVPDPRQIKIVREKLIASEEAQIKNLTPRIKANIESKVDDQIDAILKKEDLQELNAFVSQNRRLNKAVVKRRGDIDIEIRKLMGEVTNPSDNIRLTINKLASLTETNKFYETLSELGGQVPSNKALYRKSLEQARQQLRDVDPEDLESVFTEGSFVSVKTDDVSGVGQIVSKADDGTFSVEIRDIDNKATTLDNLEYDPFRPSDGFGEGNIITIPPSDVVRSKANSIYRRAVKNSGSPEAPFTEAKYIFKSRRDFPRDSDGNFIDYDKHKKTFSVQIENTGSFLDGSWTTPEMARAISNMEDTFILQGHALKNNPIYRYSSGIKGATQNMKTIWDSNTHLRNAFGSFQWGLANGINPMSGGMQSFRGLANEILSDGSGKKLSAFTEKMQGYGVLGTNVRAREIEAMLEAAGDTNPANFFKRLEAISESYPLADNPARVLAGKGIKFARKANQKAEQIYMAWDDFFKMNAFQTELATLQKAQKAGYRPNASLKDLEVEAAEKVKSTFQNYDRVPKALRGLRGLPTGNFVSFPAEVIRTSGNILREAAKEITSGNSVLRQRGLQRLAGFSLTNMAWGVAGTSGYNVLLGMTEEENKALQTLAEKPYGKNHNKVFKRIDGQLYEHDPTYLNTFDLWQGLALTMHREAALGELYGDDVKQRIIDTTIATLGKMVEPFTEEAMYFTTLRDLQTAMRDDQGRNSEGIRIFETSLDDRSLNRAYDLIDNTLAYIYKKHAPGVLLDAERIANAIMEKPNPTTGAKTSKGAVALEMLTGINFKAREEQDMFVTQSKEYMGATDYVLPNLKNSVRYGTEVEYIRNKYLSNQAIRYKSSQNYYRMILAMKTLGYTDGPIRKLMEEANVTGHDATNLINGVFTPDRISQDLIEDIRVELKGSEKEIESLIEDLKKYSHYLNSYVPLHPYSDDLREISRMIRSGDMSLLSEPRDKKVSGGVLSEDYPVPGVPKNPSSRIDKTTGENYDSQAGKAFEDPLSRLGFGRGGELPRQQKFFGGMADKIVGKLSKILGRSPLQLTNKKELGFEAAENPVDWASRIGEKLGGNLDGQGDAARHIGLAWLIKNSTTPELNKKYLYFREMGNRTKGMDRHNNEIGYSLEAANRQEAEAKILELVKQTKPSEFGKTPDANTPLYYSLSESKNLRGYAEGGSVDPLVRLGFGGGSEVTTAGRKIHERDGEQYSEKTITFEVDNGKWLTFPSIDKEGKTIPQSKVEDYVKEKGPVDPLTSERFPLHDTKEEAVEWAKKRSNSLIRDQKYAGSKIYKTLRKRNTEKVYKHAV